MKRLDLVQLVIIITGLFSAFFFLNHIPEFLLYIFAWFSEGLSGGMYMGALIQEILALSMYLLIAIYAIKHSGLLAKWICARSDMNAAVNLSLNRQDLLFALFLGLGIYGIIKNIPTLIVNCFNRIKDSNSFLPVEGIYPYSNPNLVMQAITVLLFSILVFYAKTFAEFFAARISNTEPEDAISIKET